jgi:hypothetical protein
MAGLLEGSPQEKAQVRLIIDHQDVGHPSPLSAAVTPSQHMGTKDPMRSK